MKSFATMWQTVQAPSVAAPPHDRMDRVADIFQPMLKLLRGPGSEMLPFKRTIGSAEFVRDMFWLH